MRNIFVFLIFYLYLCIINKNNMDFTKYTLVELWDIREKLNNEITNVKNREKRKAFRVSTDFELKFFSKKENAIKHLIDLINDEDEDTHFFSFDEGLEANTVYLDEAEYTNLCVDLINETANGVKPVL